MVCFFSFLSPPLVGACFATGDRIFCDRKRWRLKNCFAILSRGLRAYNHGVKRLQKPKTYCENSILRSYLSLSVFTVRSGPVWRQDLAILSPEGPRDITCQLRARCVSVIARSGRESCPSCSSFFFFFGVPFWAPCVLGGFRILSEDREVGARSPLLRPFFLLFAPILFSRFCFSPSVAFAAYMLGLTPE